MCGTKSFTFHANVNPDRKCRKMRNAKKMMQNTPLYFSFFTFHEHFCIFRDKCIASLRKCLSKNTVDRLAIRRTTNNKRCIDGCSLFADLFLRIEFFRWKFSFIIYSRTVYSPLTQIRWFTHYLFVYLYQTFSTILGEYTYVRSHLHTKNMSILRKILFYCCRKKQQKVHCMQLQQSCGVCLQSCLYTRIYKKYVCTLRTSSVAHAQHAGV